ncbi:heptaprenyl diphosphate synthase component 1 [Salibacterium aidingense]|uniref:heptaprenyl diphosphate synthase component 1 n=1 Tax=Salibacterium aidingense TaxID=384933 RepID=UPI003BD9E704
MPVQPGLDLCYNSGIGTSLPIKTFIALFYKHMGDNSMINEPYEAVDVQRIERAFKNMTSHSYLKQYIEEADIEYDIIFFMREILAGTDLTEDQKKEQILSALFVQAAFATHEKVENDRGSSPAEKKPKQLTVLAGDFFSSLYHTMLINNVHSTIIPVFSDAIQRINEEKMCLHFGENTSEDELMQRLALVEGCFFKNISAFYGKPELGSLAETFFLLKRLNREREYTEVKFLSAAAGAVHQFFEKELREKVKNWPPERTEKWLSDKISHLKKELYQQLHTFSFQQDSALYDRLLSWTAFQDEAEIK